MTLVFCKCRAPVVFTPVMEGEMETVILEIRTSKNDRSLFTGNCNYDSPPRSHYSPGYLNRSQNDIAN